MATAKKAKVIEIHDIQLGHMDVTIVGTTPLIVHAWSEKAKRMMLETQRKTKTGAKHDVKIPINDFMDSLYWLTEQPEHGRDDMEAEANWANAVENDAKFGFPVTGIKQAVVSGSKRGGLDVVMAELRGTMFLQGATQASTTDLAEIITPAPPTMREDMVRVGGASKSADIRYRAEFAEGWKIPLRITYVKGGKYSVEQLLNMFNYGGFVTGIGEWRPEKDGQFGMFRVDA